MPQEHILEYAIIDPSVADKVDEDILDSISFNDLVQKYELKIVSDNLYIDKNKVLKLLGEKSLEKNYISYATESESLLIDEDILNESAALKSALKTKNNDNELHKSNLTGNSSKIYGANKAEDSNIDNSKNSVDDKMRWGNSKIDLTKEQIQENRLIVHVKEVRPEQIAPFNYEEVTEILRKKHNFSKNFLALNTAIQENKLEDFLNSCILKETKNLKIHPKDPIFFSILHKSLTSDDIVTRNLKTSSGVNIVNHELHSYHIQKVLTKPVDALDYETVNLFSEMNFRQILKYVKIDLYSKNIKNIQ